jgi:hypothetical protein
LQHISHSSLELMRIPTDVDVVYLGYEIKSEKLFDKITKTYNYVFLYKDTIIHSGYVTTDPEIYVKENLIEI